MIASNSNFNYSSSLFLTDSPTNLLEPIETKSQHFLQNLKHSSHDLNAQSSYRSKPMEPFIFSRNQKISQNKKSNKLFSKNNSKSFEKKTKQKNNLVQSIEKNVIANGFNNGSNELIDKPETFSTKLKQIGNFIKQQQNHQVPTANKLLEAKSYDSKEFAFSLTNHNYFSQSIDNFQGQHSKISNLTENISGEINKIIKNYPSIYLRRKDKGKKPLPKLQNYLYENHIKYDLAKQPLQQIKSSKLQSSSKNSNKDIPASTDSKTNEMKILDQEENYPSHFEASSFINQSILNGTSIKDED